MITLKKFSGGMEVLRTVGVVGLAVLMLLTSVTVAQAQTPPPRENETPPTRERLREMAAEYPGITFNSSYTGKMPATEAKAYAQLDLLASFKREINDLTSSTSVNVVEDEEFSGNNLVQGTRWQSCNAYIGNVDVTVLTWAKVRHTVFVTHDDTSPWNITNVEQHSTAFSASGITIGGILVQVVYDELSKWVEGPEMRRISDLNAHKAFWKLASKFHAHFTAGPFNYSIYNQTRKCEIA